MVLHTTKVKDKDKTKENRKETTNVSKITCKKELSNR